MQEQPNSKVTTGIEGLNEILNDGLPHCCSYLVRGDAGTGKTILGTHFLVQGVKSGERILYISLQEKEKRIRANAAKVGRDTHGIDFLRNGLKIGEPLHNLRGILSGIPDFLE